MFNCSSFVTSCVVIRCRVFIPYSCRCWFHFLSYIIFLFYLVIYLFASLPYLSLLLALLLLLFTLSRPNLQPIFKLIFGPSSGPARTHYSIHFSVHSQADVGPKSGQNRQGPFSRPYPYAVCFLFHLLVYCSSPVSPHAWSTSVWPDRNVPSTFFPAWSRPPSLLFSHASPRSTKAPSRFPRKP